MTITQTHNAKKISVHLYGGKGLGRETPLEADTIFCEMTDNCSYYNAGKCLRHRAFMAPETCKYGWVRTEKGYTSRAAKYYEWKKVRTSDPEYGKMDYPNTYIAVIGDWLYLRTLYVDVQEHRDRERYIRCQTVCGYDLSDPGFGQCFVFLPIDQVTNDLLYAIFSFHPYAMMGGLIKDYSEKHVPEMLQELRKVAPNIYEKFVSEYPEYRFEPNYIGKTAYVNSLKPGTVFRVDKKGEWLFDGEYVSSVGKIDIGFGSPWWSQGGALAEGVKIKVDPKMTFKVMDNNIVDENTRFA